MSKIDEAIFKLLNEDSQDYLVRRDGSLTTRPSSFPCNIRKKIIVSLNDSIYTTDKTLEPNIIPITTELNTLITNMWAIPLSSIDGDIEK